MIYQLVEKTQNWPHHQHKNQKKPFLLFGFLNFLVCINYQYEESRCKECLYVQNIIRLLIKTTADIHAQHWPYWWKNSELLSLGQAQHEKLPVFMYS